MRRAYGVLALLLVLAGCSEGADPAADPTERPSAADTPSSAPTDSPELDWQPAKAADDGPHRETLTTETHRLVVEQDPQETRPARAVLTDLASGQETVLDGDAEVPTTTGGSWSLGDDLLAYPSVGPGGAYCLATMTLTTGEAAVAWCAPERTGFTGVQVTDAGVALQTFDDAQPSCRTVGRLDGDAVTPFADAPDCTAWDALLLDSGPVWSVVRRENDVERVDLFATGPDGVVELGPGTSGTLIGCGGSAYFVRDPQRAADPARLVRWDGSEVEVVYESPAGPAFLEEPRCEGTTLTVSALAEGGDETVAAEVG